MSDFPQYTPDGVAGMTIVNDYWANAAIYCEDQSHEAFYERLFRRLFPGNNDFYVQCLSGKSEVLSYAKKANSQKVAEIFLVDKDYDDLVGEISKNSVPGVIYLRRFSIENYLSSIDGLIQIALEERVKDGMTLLKFRPLIADGNKFMNDLIQKLDVVCRYFAVARKNRIPFYTTKVSSSDVYRNSNSEYPLPDDDWIFDYMQSFKETCGQYHEWVLDETLLKSLLVDAYDAPERPWGTLGSFDQVVGKLLLAGAIRYVDKRLKCKLVEIPDNQLFTKLAVHIDITPLAYLKEEMLKIAPGLG